MPTEPVPKSDLLASVHCMEQRFAADLRASSRDIALAKAIAVMLVQAVQDAAADSSCQPSSMPHPGP
jgi:hypothetical protein